MAGVDGVFTMLQRTFPSRTILLGLFAFLLSASGHGVLAEPLEGTDELTWQGDLAARLVDQADAFLLRELERSIERRAQHWRRDFSSLQGHADSLGPQRERLKHILGLRDTRHGDTTPRVDATAQLAIAPVAPSKDAKDSTSPLVFPQLYARAATFDVYAIQWPAFGDVSGVGLLLEPKRAEACALVVAIPDCEVTPEQLVGLQPGLAAESQYARRLAERGCRVIVPTLINRQRGQFDWAARSAPDVTNREMIYRSAFELGRGLIGYEMQQVLAIVDWYAGQRKADQPIGVIGWGEGGLLALYCGAVDTRIDRVCVSGYFGSRQRIWNEPIDRNVFGLLEQFGDAELASMIAPRRLIVEVAEGPTNVLPGNGGAPAELVSPGKEEVLDELNRTTRLLGPLGSSDWLRGLVPAAEDRGPGAKPTLDAFLQGTESEASLAAAKTDPPRLIAPLADHAARHRRLMQQLDRHNQQVLRASADVRRQFLRDLDTSSLERFHATVEPYRKHFREEVIGQYEYELPAPRPRTRMVYETDAWRGYEVVLDLFDDLFAYGLLLIPKDLTPAEKRPVVVCQHGLEGRPQDTVGVQGAGAYQGFAGKLAERGFVVFSPQNLYIGQDRFRTLQRKSYPLKKTLFSIIVPQHQQIVDWLQTLEFVDPERIAFYGLSYGGKTAMRVPPLVTDYCLSICSADFNEWVDKNASTTNPRSYVWTGEYEIFEFDLGSTFNYAEMATLIAPRPFMVERGHDDGVADDWTVAWEFAKVRNLYASKLKLPERCRIEWFDGPHTIHGKGTYEFLHQYLNWPEPAGHSVR